MKYLKKILLIFALGLSANAFAQPRAVLVHGFMRGKGNMAAIESSLKKEGFETTNWTYPSKKETIEEHGKNLVQELLYIAKESPGEPIHFASHSMGGLVIRSALNHPNCPNEAKIGRAVLVAPPNRGSAFARSLGKSFLFKSFFGDKAGNQLRTTESDGFDYLGQFPSTVQVLIISGTAGINPLLNEDNDGKVAVSETCLNTPHYHQNCKAGHSWICYSPKVIRITKEFLTIETINRSQCKRILPS